MTACLEPHVGLHVCAMSAVGCSLRPRQGKPTRREPSRMVSYRSCTCRLCGHLRTACTRTRTPVMLHVCAMSVVG